MFHRGCRSQPRFRISGLAPWAPLTNGDNPGPYELCLTTWLEQWPAIQRLSNAHRSWHRWHLAKRPDLTGGITYTLSVDMVSAQEGGGCWVGAQASLGIGNSNAYWNMPNLCGGQSARGRIELLFTAQTNGAYALNLSVSWGSPWWIIPAELFLLCGQRSNRVSATRAQRVDEWFHEWRVDGNDNPSARRLQTWPER